MRNQRYVDLPGTPITPKGRPHSFTAISLLAPELGALISQTDRETNVANVKQPNSGAD